MNTTSTSEAAMAILCGRRSIRVYKTGSLTEELITKLLEAAMSAPSAVEADPWRFVVVRDPAQLRAMARVLSNGEMLLGSGTGIVICGDIQAAHDGQLSYLLQDCAAAIENLLLCAHAHDLGACWLGVHPREQRMGALRKILSLPDSVIPVACVSVGEPGEHKEPRTRYRREYIHWDRW